MTMRTPGGWTVTPVPARTGSRGEVLGPHLFIQGPGGSWQATPGAGRWVLEQIVQCAAFVKMTRLRGRDQEVMVGAAAIPYPPVADSPEDIGRRLGFDWADLEEVTE